ncbi:NAD(P)-dependent dehydrogenase (short-subunit alcohol dehydrogenase family) [Aliiruegeria haliotis]|uniref:NAD(P)-dependent dehydrogenase (Short-subunit alcohol dehydrogenase family) n=1 Tax=Aliiruegeria haliotis TaxID=1280846 RepID=A0A2T0RRW7_9RHOB|nr:SDR family oxidoreductase [Aliiruegeria haliotis]PRY23833.1 NAD(P)-dependent dehydrogenase (short-subunit alcohol dehydrogenase family) [Aliiruegeria haliotis]
MTDNRALVTGAAKRIGRAMAWYLAGRGYDVAVHFHGSREAADSLVQEIRSIGRSAVAVQADLTLESDMQRLLPEASAALGGAFNLLVNNASIFEMDRIGASTRESWDRHLESNLRAPVVLTEHFAAQAPPAIYDHRQEPLSQSLVVNLLDQRVRKLTPAFMSYTVAKMGLWAFTQTAAQALAPRIRVNAIGPGPTLKGAEQDEAHFVAQRAATVLQRGSNPEDITAALGYFLDAPGVTGQLLCVDGGQHLAWKTADILDVS